MQVRYGARTATPSVMKSFVDTCFLMNEPGRQYLLQTGMKCTVIDTVKKELERQIEKNNKRDAQAALDFMKAHAGLFEELPACSEERDMRFSVREGQEISADSVFRRIAIRCADEQIPVHFLTADGDLASVLSLYASRITYLSRRSGRVCDWQEHLEEEQGQARADLSNLMAESDLVLSSSGLKSPHLRQFLRNVQLLKPKAEERPILHLCSQERLSEQNHLPLDVIDLLADSAVIRHCGCETPYQSETALLDALYYARSMGRRVTVIVSDWHDVVQRYDAQSHAAEPGADAVNFRLITFAGGLMPLLCSWSLRKMGCPEPTSFPVAPGLVPAPQPEPERAPVVECTPRPSKGGQPANVDKKREKKSAGMTCEEAYTRLHSRFRQQMESMSAEDFAAELLKVYGAEDMLSIRVAAIKVARRCNKPTVVACLLKSCPSLPSYCLENWFARNAKSSPPVRDLLKRRTFYECTKKIIQCTQDTGNCTAVMTTLLNLMRDKDPDVGMRAEMMRNLLVSKGAPQLG